jgi:guanylate kinase
VSCGWLFFTPNTKKEKMIERPSFIVTGASASGKSTLVEEALNLGRKYLPTHMTRNRRTGEIDGVHGIFLDRQQFEANFDNGGYLEPDLDYAELKALGIYYGTPKLWLTELKLPEKCASPVAIKMAREVFNLTGVDWLHLVCDNFDRVERLRARGIPESEIVARMNAGESARIVPAESRVFDTSDLKPKEILSKIRSGK